MTSIWKLFSHLDPNRRQKAIRSDFEKTFSTPHGRRTLAEIARLGGVQRVTLVVHERAAALAEGRRWLALEILKTAGADTGRLGDALLADRLEEMTDGRRSDHRNRNDRDREDRTGDGDGDRDQLAISADELVTDGD